MKYLKLIVKTTNLHMNTDLNQYEKPKTVKNAVVVLYVTMGIGVLKAVIKAPAEILPTIERFNYWGLLFSILMVFLLLAAIIGVINMIGRGSNRWRIFFLVIFILGLCSDCMKIYNLFFVDLLYASLDLIIIVLQIVALSLLFHKDSSAWFKSKLPIK